MIPSLEINTSAGYPSGGGEESVLTGNIHIGFQRFRVKINNQTFPIFLRRS